MGVVRFVKLEGVGVDEGVFKRLKEGRIPSSGCGETKAVAFFFHVWKRGDKHFLLEVVRVFAKGVGVYK